jgi:hypothetical protein
VERPHLHTLLEQHRIICGVQSSTDALAGNDQRGAKFIM